MHCDSCIRQPHTKNQQNPENFDPSTKCFSCFRNKKKLAKGPDSIKITQAHTEIVNYSLCFLSVLMLYFVAVFVSNFSCKA